MTITTKKLTHTHTHTHTIAHTVAHSLRIYFPRVFLQSLGTNTINENDHSEHLHFPLLLVLSVTVKLEPFNARDNFRTEGRMRATELLTEAS